LPDQRKTIALAVLDIFTRCTHLSIVKKQTCAIPHSQLIDNSLCQFTSYFLTLEEVEGLSVDDWDKFFRGLSGEQINDMVSLLIEDLQKVAANEKILHSLALARIAIYSKAPPARLFEPKAMSLFIPQFDREKDIPLQLLLRVKWILAIRAFMQKSNVINPILLAEKQIIAQGLIDGFLSSMQKDDDFKNYSPFIFEALKDPEAAVVINDSFRFSETHPVAARVNVLKSMIELKIKSQTNQ